MKFSIIMPVFNGEKVIKETLNSILHQSFTNFELIIVDDFSRDNTSKIVENFKDPRIKYFKNKENLGYSGNLETCFKKANGEIIYLMSQDDILGKDALLYTYKAFNVSEDIGAVTRPYFWFDKKISIPVRAKNQLNFEKDEVVTINDNFDRILRMFQTLDQFSGLALRRKYIHRSFHKDIFTCHVYPFASIFKEHPVVFLKDYNVAVRIRSSQSRSVSSIYNKSPVKSWIDFLNDVFCEKKFNKFREYFIYNFVTNNYIGLIQIRNYAKYRFFIREVCLLIKYRPDNVLNPIFWFFSLGCMLMPAKLLIPMVDWYKNNLNARFVKKIKFKYDRT